MSSAKGARGSSRVWALTDQAIQSGANFLTMVLAARFLTVESFASFSLAYLATLFVSSLHRTWITQPMNVLGGQAPADLPARAGALWSAHAAMIPAGALLVIAIAPFGFLVPTLVLATCAYLGLAFLQEMGRRYAYTRFRLDHATAITAASSFVQLVILGGLAVQREEDPAIWMAGLAVSQFVGALTGMVLSKVRAALAQRRSSRAVLAEQFGHSRWVIASQLVYWGGSQIYPFLVAGVGAGYAATFNAGMSILNASNVLRLSLANFLPAQAGRIHALHGEAALFKYARSALVKIGVAGLVAWPIVFFASGWFVELLYGSKFPGAEDVIRWIAIGVLASMFSVVLNSVALAVGTTRNIFLSNALAAVFSLTAGVYLTKRLGLVGAIWGNVVGYCIPAVWQLIHLWPRLRAAK